MQDFRNVCFFGILTGHGVAVAILADVGGVISDVGVGGVSLVRTQPLPLPVQTVLVLQVVLHVRLEIEIKGGNHKIIFTSKTVFYLI